jgi:uncharacterized protein YraI
MGQLSYEGLKMNRQAPLRYLIVLIIALVVGLITVTMAMADTPNNTPNAITTIETNLRTGPGRTYDTLSVLPTGTKLVVEGRSDDMLWLLVHLPDNSARGWVVRKLIQLNGDIRVRDLPVFTVVTAGKLTIVTASAPTWTPIPAYDPNTSIDGPIIPAIDNATRDTMQVIYDRGQGLGNNPHVFIKVGDCMTYRWTFLNVFGYGQYNLGQYGSLQSIIDYFNVQVRPGVPNSWVVKSVAAANGFNSTAVLDAEWSDPALCKAGEAPIVCEMRINKPSYMVMMFGASDVFSMTPQQFNVFMREDVDLAEKAGVIPILSTFPENPTALETSRTLNQIVFQIATEKHLPIMNFNKAVVGLPHHGLEGDNIHLTLPPGDKSGYFTPDNLQYGYTVRNLVVLQALNAVVGAIRH